MWPGLVGKGPDSEPPIDLDTMLDLTAAAEVDGARFEGVDLFLSLPHTDIDSSDDDLARLADNLQSKNLRVGSLVAPVWPPTGGGSAMGDDAERAAFLTQVRKACRIGSKLRDLGVRQYGVIRIDSARARRDWAKDPAGNTKRDRRDVPRGRRHRRGVRRAARRRRRDLLGAACIAGGATCELLEMVGRPKTLGFQADMAHTLLFTMGYNAPEDAPAAGRFRLVGPSVWPTRYEKMTDALRPWTIDFHVAQNDGTVNGSGSHDKTGRHCQPHDPNGKLDIVRDAGYWLRDDDGQPDARLPAHLLGRLHVPQRRHAATSRPGTTSCAR